MADLEAQKADAIAEEDFDEAKRLKLEIEAVRSGGQSSKRLSSGGRLPETSDEISRPCFPFALEAPL